MKHYNVKNINTPEYWDGVYKGEEGTGKTRIDRDRLDYLVKELGETDKLLDVGCGNGELLMWVNNDRPNVVKYGVDIAKETLETCQRGWPDWTLIAATVHKMPFPDEFFDVVFCGETLEHVDHPNLALEELFRVCKKGGKVVISVPNEDRNTSVEHLTEFSLQDCLVISKMYGINTNIKVLCSGLSIIFTTIRQ